MTGRTRDEIERDLVEAAPEVQRITKTLKTLEDGSATGTTMYRRLRDELPRGQQL